MTRVSGPLIAFVIAFLVSTAIFSTASGSNVNIVSELGSSFSWLVEKLN